MDASRFFRACLKIGDVSGSEGFWAAGKQFFRRNPDGFQGKIAPSRGQKTRRLGMLPFFKQDLVVGHPFYHPPDAPGVLMGDDVLKAVLSHDLLHVWGLAHAHLEDQGSPQPQGGAPVG